MTNETRVAVALERIAAALEAQNTLLAGAENAEPVCLHPAEEREDHSTMGHPRWRCKALLIDGTPCGFSVGMDT